MPGRDLERLAQTRVMPVSHRPDAVMRGGRSEVSPRALEAHGVRAVGAYRQVAPDQWSVPVVYVSQRAAPWYGRRWVHITAIVVGAILALGALVTWAILALGVLGFAAAVFVSALAVALLARVARGGPRGGVSVTTTTTTRVRVR